MIIWDLFRPIRGPSRIIPCGLIFFFSLVLCTSGLSQPSQVHLTWQNDTGTSVTVNFRSGSSDGRVEYGPSLVYGSVRSVTGTSYADSYIHHIELTGLAAGTVYHYRCGNPSDGWSQDYTFKTSSTPDTPFIFGAFSDSQNQTNVRRTIKNSLKTFSPDFCFLAGDSVDTGTNQSLWDKWFSTMQDLSAVSPIMTCLGNHEENSYRYYDQFSLPGNGVESGYFSESYYSFNYNNAHFICLYTDMDQMGLQKTWLSNDLRTAADDPDIQWKFVYFHKPVYTWAAGHTPNTNAQRYWVPLFEQYRVDMVFSGHNHLYEESNPIKAGVRTTEQLGGVRYITMGGSGGSLVSPGATNSLLAYTVSVHHHCLANITGGQLVFQAKYTNGNTFRTISITKSTSPVLSGIRTSPSSPTSAEAITFYAEAFDFDRIKWVKLYYRINSGSFSEVSMVFSSGRTWSCSIPKQARSAIVDYYLKVSDNLDTTAVYDNAGSYYRFIVSDSGKLETGGFSLTGIEPGKVFSPDAPSPDNELKLYVSYPEIRNAAARIYSVSGSLVRTLPLKRLNMNSGYFYWNGRDDNSVPGGNGVYIYQIECSGDLVTGTIIMAR
ncbi:MAG: metallophosphoesterase [bacterium]|nr:metallophosphoesterase [bacterium]